MSRASDRRRSSGGEGGGGGANWMDTYGDLVTLLLTFFVLLFSFSSIDADKWKALVGAFSGSTVTIIEPFTPELVNAEPIPTFNTMRDIEDHSDPMEEIAESTADELLIELYEGMMEYIDGNDIDAEVQLYASEYMIVVRFNENVFFSSGDAVLRPASIEVLDHVVEMFSQLNEKYLRLNIEGHTDNVPINTSRYPSNWELSIDRAMSVQRYIMSTGRMDPRRMKIGGYGEYDPIAPNDTAEGRALNRRVDFVVEGIRPNKNASGG